MKDTDLLVTSIFTSIDGEVNGFGQGTLTTFIRLAGCNLRCWKAQGGCDTPQALSRDGGTKLTVDAIMDTVREAGTKKVTITGGEPLLQKEGLGPLLLALDQESIGISVETNGTLMPDCEGHWAVGSWVYDHKCPSTGEHGRMIPLPVLYSRLCDLDYIKFVISDDEDYRYAVNLVKSLPPRTTAPSLAFSPMASGMGPAELVSRMIQDKLAHVQFNLQMHKYIWPDANTER